MAWLRRRVPAPRQPEHLAPSTRGHFDRCRGVVGREAITIGEAGDVADIADDGGGDDRSDPEQARECRVRRGDGGGDPPAGVTALDPQPVQVGDEFHSELVASSGDRPDWFELVEQSSRLSWADLNGDAARDEIAEHRMQSAGDPVVLAGQVTVTLRPHLHHRCMILDMDLRNRRRPQGGDGHRAGIVGIVLVRVASRQQPDPGGELRLHVDDALTGGDKLLRQ